MATKSRPRTKMVAFRVEPELLEAIEEQRRGNKIESQSEMIRLLIRGGIRAVVEDQGNSEPRLPANDVVLVHVDALNDVLEQVRQRDPRAAIQLAAGAATAFGRWAEMEATGIGTTVPDVIDESAGTCHDSGPT